MRTEGKRQIAATVGVMRVSLWTQQARGDFIVGAKDLAPGSLWSGMIDDVCIYNRTVKP
jgi:hypothetical protein